MFFGWKTEASVVFCCEKRSLQSGCVISSFFLSPQNMLVEIEQKVVALSELSVHSENLLLEGKAHTKDEAEQLAAKLRTLKGSLVELQRALHDKQLNIQVRAPASGSEAGLLGQPDTVPCWRAFLSLGCIRKRRGMVHTYIRTCFMQPWASIFK